MASQQPTDCLGPRKLINRTEYVRLLEQALHKLGYSSVAQQLETLSGIQMQPPTATLFQQRVLSGEWEGALELLPSLLEGQAVTQAEEELRDARFLIRQQQYLEAVERGDVETALAVLRTQLAPLAGEHHTARLHHLAGLLLMPAPAHSKSGTQSGQQWSQWLGGGVAHRSALLAQIQVYFSCVDSPSGKRKQHGACVLCADSAGIDQELLGPTTHLCTTTCARHFAQAALPPWLMIPEGRLEVLVEQALETQIARCPFHNLIPGGGSSGPGAATAGLTGSSGLSLLTDYQAGVESLPSRCVQVLTSHTDEVWHLSFSHSGHMLASGSKDKTAIVWSVKTPPPLASPMTARLMSSATGQSTAPVATPSMQLVTPLHTLTGHEEPVLFVSWSPNDQHLLSVSDVTIRLWDPSTGTLQHTYTHHKEAVMCCAWFPDSQRFVSGSVDRTLALLDTSGRELQRFKRSYRVQDLAINASGTELIIAASDKQIHILRLSDQREVTLAESSSITSIDLSSDGRFLLANLQSQAVHLWHFGALVQQPINQPIPPDNDPLDQLPGQAALEYREPGVEIDQMVRYVVRSSFGGSAGNFVVHGSETGRVYIWHRDTGTLLLRLEGHHATVNACSWPVAAPQLLATASDDRTIRIWLAEAALLSTRSQILFSSPQPMLATM